MIYNFVSGKHIIGKIYDEFNIKTRDWENRAPEWIANGLKHLNINLSWKEEVEKIKFDNYTINLPCNLRVLRSIVIDNTKLNRTTTSGHKMFNEIIGEHSRDLRFYSIDDGKVTVEIKSGEATVVYWKVPLDWDDVLGMWIPRVPDVPDVIDNIAWYILRIILARGYQHSVYNLNSPNELTNPHLQWSRGRKRARMAAKSMDSEQRKIMAETLSKFVANPHADVEELFAPSGRTDRRIRPSGWREDLINSLEKSKEDHKWSEIEW